MNFLKIILMPAFFSLVLNTSPNSKPFEYTLQGVVANKETGKPLPDIYLYTVKGEEEAITNQKGEFKFVSWQKLPLTLYIHKENENIRVLISNPSEFIKIKL
jgi:hypothetical protein